MRAISMVLLLGGCSGVLDGDVAGTICHASNSPDDAAAFHALTRTTWYDSGRCNSSDRLPPTCNRLELGSDTVYTWTAFSDYAERDQRGTWNLHARDATHGLVCLNDGSAVDFAVEGDVLWWGPLALSPDQPKGTLGSAEELPTLSVDPLFVALTANLWVKTDATNLFYLPTAFRLYRDGTFTAEFRNGECTATGTFSLISERYAQTSRFMLWSRPEPNACDPRDGGRPAFALGDAPEVSDGVLTFFNASYTAR